MKRAIPLLTVFILWSASAHAMGPSIHAKLMANELEYAFNDSSNPVVWNGSAWIGGDWNRIWIKTEGDVSTVEQEVEGEVQLLYSRLFAPFWEVQVGVRGDLALEDETNGRGFLVFGLEGLIPYRFEFEPSIFVSHEGDVSARLDFSYDIFLTQRMIAVPSLEINAAVQSVPEFGVGAWLNDTEVALRIRYEFSRKFAPYLGVSYEQNYFETADFRTAANLSTFDVRGVAGVRFWF